MAGTWSRRLMGTKTEDDGAIYTIDLATGAWTRLPYQKGAGDADLSPVYSPDGRWIAFHRNVSLSDMWRVPASGGKPERLTDLRHQHLSIAWTPDGQVDRVRALSRRVGVVVAAATCGTRQVSDFGVPNTAYPSVAAKRAVAGLHPLPVAVGACSASTCIAIGRPRRTQTGGDAGVSLDRPGPAAVDRRRMGGRSRSCPTVRRGSGVWWAQLGRPESLRLIEGVIPVPRYAAVWSRDSRADAGRRTRRWRTDERPRQRVRSDP